MHFSVTFSWKNDHEWLDSHAYEVVNKDNTKYVSYLMFPHPHDQVFKQSMVFFN